MLCSKGINLREVFIHILWESAAKLMCFLPHLWAVYYILVFPLSWAAWDYGLPPQQHIIYILKCPWIQKGIHLTHQHDIIHS